MLSNGKEMIGKATKNKHMEKICQKLNNHDSRLITI
jgi:hypothetical protein